MLKLTGTIFNKSIQILAFADDVDIIGRSEEDVREEYEVLEAATRGMGLVNTNKTKYMRMLRPVKNKIMQMGQTKIEAVDKFIYLGAIVNVQIGEIKRG